jgi:1,4-alpha-glucan branching enzyme
LRAPGFAWIDASDWEHSIISYIRRASDGDDCLVIVANFTPTVHRGYRLGVPARTTWREVLNSDAARYHGSDVGNDGPLVVTDIPWQSQPCSLEMTLPPLAVVVLRPDR